MQYSARSDRLSVHKLFTFCIRRGLGSRDSIDDGDWLPVTEWCQRWSYLPSCQPASNVAENLGRFLVRSVSPGNDFELIPTLKMESRNLVVGNFGIEFPAVCNYCGFMSASSHRTLAIFEIFCIFFWKNDILRQNFHNFIPKVFIATPIDVLC